MTISAKVVADSAGPSGKRLTTMQWRYPKFVHGEVMTHRQLSRNASSSRAIPVERLIKDVLEDPVYPMHWGKNQPGMQADEECDERVPLSGDMWFGYSDPTRKEAWDVARDNAVSVARAFTQARYHKQIVNRLLEPFCHINVIVSGTEWSNFFALRCHPAAQPEMRELAEKARDAMAASIPRSLKPGEWHLPYVDLPEWNEVMAGCGRDFEASVTIARKLSVARCARVSYLTQDGKAPTVEEDLKLHDRLVSAVPLHASPCEHQATPDEMVQVVSGDSSRGYRWARGELHGNFVGFCQYRKMLPGECQ